MIALIRIIALDQPGGGSRIEVRHLAAFILDDRIDFVTQAEVDNQSWPHTPIVLKEDCVTLIAQVPYGIAEKQVGPA